MKTNRSYRKSTMTSTAKTWALIMLLPMAGFAAIPEAKAQSFAVCTKVSQYPVLRKAGYTYVEPNVADFLAPDKSDSAFAVQLAEQKRLKAKIISCVVFIPGRMRITGAEAAHDDIIRWAETAFRRAEQAGIPYIVLGSGGARRVPENFDREEATRQFTALCKRLAPLAERHGVTVVVEPLHSGETNLINSLKEGAAIVEAVDHPNVRLLCDIYHMMKDNEPASEIVRYGPYIKHCHIAEKETRSAPGTAGDDFTPYFDALKQINYTGCISIEARFDNFETRIVSSLEYMRKQIE